MARNKLPPLLSLSSSSSSESFCSDGSFISSSRLSPILQCSCRYSEQWTNRLCYTHRAKIVVEGDMPKSHQRFKSHYILFGATVQNFFTFMYEYIRKMTPTLWTTKFLRQPKRHFVSHVLGLAASRLFQHFKFRLLLLMICGLSR